MADPYSAYFLIELFPDKELDEDVDGMYESITSIISGRVNPFKSVTMVFEGVGWETDIAILAGDDDDQEKKEPETLFDWLEHLLKTKEVRGGPNGGKTSIILLKEVFSPGVETLDYLGWDVVDLTQEEYDKLLGMANTGSCGAG